MPFRPFRSLAFWLGLPGLLFLLWAWADSMSHRSGLHVDKVLPGPRFVIVNFIGYEAAGFGVQWGDAPEPQGLGSRLGGTTLTRTPITGPAESFFPPAGYTRLPAHGSGSTSVVPVEWRFLFVPFWQLVALYLAVWWGLLAWRRRVRRAAEQKSSTLPGAAAA